MASTAANVYAAKPKTTGALRWAPLGTTAPTDGDTALDAGFIDLGYISEDGFTVAVSRDTDKKKAFGGATVKVLQTDYTNTYQFTLMELLNPTALQAAFGEDNVTVAGENITIAFSKDTLPHGSWVIDTKDGDNMVRIYVPDGQVTEQDDIVFTHTDTVNLSLTVEAFEDEAGKNAYTFVYKMPSGS